MCIVFVLDYIGLLTEVPSERQYEKSGNVTRKIELELIDDKYFHLILCLVIIFLSVVFVYLITLFCVWFDRVRSGVLSLETMWTL